MKIEILGTGCPKCKKLAKNAEEALEEMGIDAEIVKVTKIKDIMKYGVMMTPALAVEGRVVLKGKVVGKEEIKETIKKNFL